MDISYLLAKLLQGTGILIALATTVDIIPKDEQDISALGALVLMMFYQQKEYRDRMDQLQKWFQTSVDSLHQQNHELLKVVLNSQDYESP